MRGALAKKVVHFWYKKSFFAYLLVPLSWLFQIITKLRRWFYCLTAAPLPVPVIVVGNITVGGTGKSPIVAWLVQYLLNQGYTPGVIMRGYQGKLPAGKETQEVFAHSDPQQVGDEAVVLANTVSSAIMVGKNRVLAAHNLLQQHPAINIIISDDGLQHYKLHRDIEIVVVDGQRQFGNGFCLPAGPLRENIQRLNAVDFVITNQGPGALTLQQKLSEKVYNVQNKAEQNLSDFIGKTVHAVAGIGNPQRFFTMLKALGIKLIEHPFSDHHQFRAQDLNFKDNLPILMTYKDAVKCKHFAIDAYYVKVESTITTVFGQQLMEKLARGQKITRHSRLPAV